MLDKFIPQSPDKFLRKEEDMAPAKFGHINAIVDKINEITNNDGGSFNLKGTQYVFVKGDGTPEENGVELQAAYAEAKAMEADLTATITVIVAPGIYRLTEKLILDNDNVNLVSLTGNPDVVLDLTPNNLYTGTVDLSLIGGPNNLEVYNDPITDVDISMSNFYFNINPVLSIESSCYVKGIRGFEYNSWTFYTVISILFPGNETEFYPLPIDVIQTTKFTFPTVENCKGGNLSFGTNVLEYGKILNSLPPDRKTINGVFINCEGLIGAFGLLCNSPLETSKYENCKSGFGGFFLRSIGNVDATFNNCIGGNSSFAFEGTASGVFNNCTGGLQSFGRDGFLTGKVFYCRLTQGNFQSPSGSGVIRYSISGNNNQVNLG
jgi:hypothetical protein